MVAAPRSSGSGGSIAAIVPTLNEAAALPATLAALRRVREVGEVVVVDGGSEDATVALAEAAGCRVVNAPRGRGGQLRAGAAAVAASAEVLWFVHADTVVPSGAGRDLLDALAAVPGAPGGAFRVRFRGAGRTARTFTRGARFLQRVGALYGDAALFVRRGDYRASGGFADQPLFEDVDLARRLRRRGPLLRLPTEVETSARRVDDLGALRILGLWTLLHLLHAAGVSPATLARLYPPHRPRALRLEEP